MLLRGRLQAAFPLRSSPLRDHSVAGGSSPATNFTSSLCLLVPVLRNTLWRCVFTVACDIPRRSANALMPLTFMTASSTRTSVSYTHLRAHETRHDLVCRLL